MPILRQEIIDNPIPTFFFLIKNPVYTHFKGVVIQITSPVAIHKQQNSYI